MRPLKEIRFKPEVERVAEYYASFIGGTDILQHFMGEEFGLVRTVFRHDARMVKLLNKSLELLRRVYNDIEMNHLTDFKKLEYYVSVNFHQRLGNDIFNFLQSQDEVFRQTTMKRQRRWRRRRKFQATQMDLAVRLGQIAQAFVAKLEEDGLEATVFVVHDSIEFYCQPDKVEYIANMLKKITEEKS